VSIGRVGAPVEVKRPLVQRKRCGSTGGAKCYTSHDPGRVAEKRLTISEYMVSA
jgi:hypothetical protein